jgi:hypothetical protein
MGDSGTDYSDFEYQQINFEHRNDSPETSATNSNSRVKVDYDPLESKAGLDIDEVAELVYFELHADLEFEHETDSQGLPSYCELRGSFGTNLGELDEVANGDNEKNKDGPDVTVLDTFGGGFDRVITKGQTISRPEVFQMFRATGEGGFADQGSGIDTGGGLGGGGSTSPFYAEKHWRNLTGRGPVLDSSDELNLITSHITSDNVIEVGSQTRIHLVWDVSTVDDAGQKFSVPG